MTRLSHTLGFAGVDQYQQIMVRSMLTHAAPYLNSEWHLTESSSGEVVIYGAGTAADTQSCKVPVRLVDDANDKGDPLHLPTPVRLMRLLEVLKHAEGVLSGQPTISAFAPVKPTAQNGLANAPATPTAAAITQDWQGLAQLLLSARSTATPGLLKLTIDGAAPLWADLKTGVYYAPYSLSQIAGPTNVISFERMDDYADRGSVFLTPLKKIEPLLWLAGLRATPGRPAPWVKQDVRFRLKYWPNLAELPHTVTQMSIIARLSHSAMTVAEAATASKADPAQVQNVVNALTLVGLVQEDATARQTQAPSLLVKTPSTNAQPPAVSSLLGRWRRKLGF
jgi:hypothetical protein